jgi:ferredoxin
VRLRLEVETCTGHGRCYALAPSVFDADDLGHCVILDEQVPPEREAEARTAVANCPETALTIEE